MARFLQFCVSLHVIQTLKYTCLGIYYDYLWRKNITTHANNPLDVQLQVQLQHKSMQDGKSYPTKRSYKSCLCCYTIYSYQVELYAGIWQKQSSRMCLHKVGKASCISEKQAFAHGKMISVDHFLTVRTRGILQTSHFPVKIRARHI